MSTFPGRTWPRVSIITPSFNQAVYLEQTIQSVLSQDYPNLEYIIIDGGSNDGSVDIIRRYANKLAYWVSRKDNGQAEAINEGFERATGQYIAWLNSDDLYLPGCIHKAVEVFEANPVAGLVYGQVEVINETGTRIGAFRPFTYHFDDLLALRIIIPQQAAFFRADLLRQIGFLRTDLHYALDHELFIRLGANAPVASFHDVVAQYRISEINKGATQRSGWASEFVKILDDHFARPGISTKNKKTAYAGAFYRGACNLLDDENFSQARAWFIKAMEADSSLLRSPGYWRNYLRTFLGQQGNQFYLQMKIWLAKIGLINVEYDWWTALKLSRKTNE